MNLTRRLTDICGGLAIRLAGLLFDLIPPSRAYALAAGLARACYPLFRARRRIAMDNILKARVADHPQEADRIARQAFGHLAGHLCEALKVHRVIRLEQWRDHIVYDGPPSTWELLTAADLPIMILTGHLGVWEAAVSIVSQIRPMIAMARPMKSPIVERFLKSRNFRGHATIIPKNKGFTPDVLRLWKNTRAALTLVIDQRAGRRHGLRLDFMGRPAGIHTSPARLHLATGAPILVGAFIREGPFRYRMVAEEPICHAPTGNRQQDVANLLALINQRLETLVRRYPQQYLWAHNRWR